MSRGIVHGGMTLAGFLFLAGCTLGPKYSRPDVAAPPQFRGADEADAKSLADAKWFDLFHDDVLTQLVNTALAQNHDLRIAADRVIESRAQYRLAFAGELPNVNGTGAFSESVPSRI